MKKFIIAALMLTASSATFAQFTNGGSKGAAGDNSDYNKVSASFTLGSFSEKIYGSSGDGTGLYGFSVGYSHGFNLSQSLPMFLEVGGEFNFHSGSSKNYMGPGLFSKYLDPEYLESYMERHGDDWMEDITDKFSGEVEDFYEDLDRGETTLTFMNIAVPVNFLYRFDVSEKFSIAPYAGLNLKLNIVGKAKAKGATESSSFFKKDDFKKAGLDEDFAANRFQLGMNLGVNCIINKKFSAGYRFQPDFISYQSYNQNGIDYSTKITNHYFTFGYIF